MRQAWRLLHTAFRQLVAWRPSDLTHGMTANPSASDFVDAGLGDTPAQNMELLRLAAGIRTLEKLSCRR